MEKLNLIQQKHTLTNQKKCITTQTTTTTTLRPFFPGPPGWAGARRELLDFMVQGKINRGRHTDHPAGCHSIWTNQCPPPPYPPSCLQCFDTVGWVAGGHPACKKWGEGITAQKKTI